MAEVEVHPAPAAGEGTFRVVVREDASSSEHHVHVPSEEAERIAPGVGAERLVEESFRFLLEREPKESILPRFELGVISRYFPEYAEEIRRRLT